MALNMHVNIYPDKLIVYPLLISKQTWKTWNELFTIGNLKNYIANLLVINPNYIFDIRLHGSSLMHVGNNTLISNFKLPPTLDNIHNVSLKVLASPTNDIYNDSLLCDFMFEP